MAKKVKVKNKQDEPVTDKNAEILKNIKKEIEKLEKNEFKFMFFVYDTKGAPNGELYYIYNTAMVLKNMGYNVSMLHGEEDFVGVSSWMGEEYANLPHYNIETDGVSTSPSDFLIIPELYSNVMYQTMKIPSKRIVLLSNYGYLTEVIQPGASWSDYQISDCIVTTDNMRDRILKSFHSVKCNVIKPVIKDNFLPDAEKKLFINVITKDRSEMNRIVKEFFWRFPLYRWVTFRDIRGLSQDELSDALKESFMTIWSDVTTDFGYSAIQAMKSGNIVVAKVPENEIDWAYDSNGELRDNAVWFYRNDDVFPIIVGVINAFLEDSIPEKLFSEMADTVNEYTMERFTNDVKDVYIDGFVKGRKADLLEALSVLKKNEVEKTNGK